MKKLDKLILSIDENDIKDIEALVNDLCPPMKLVKIGPISFLNNHKVLFDYLKSKHVSIMLDLKFYDIPNTMMNSIDFMFYNNIKIFTVHALAGEHSLLKVKERLDKLEQETSIKSPEMFSVSILTSFSQHDIEKLNFKGSVSDNVLNLTEISIKNGADGIVCSGEEISLLRQNFGDEVKLLVPGVRFDKKDDDQKRVISPKDAIDSGASYIVLGRTLTNSKNKKQRLDDIVTSL